VRGNARRDAGFFFDHGADLGGHDRGNRATVQADGERLFDTVDGSLQGVELVGKALKGWGCICRLW
jgi:hypothetical protein